MLTPRFLSCTQLHPSPHTTLPQSGWQASFDGQTGALKPIGSKYVTDTMIEWGQVPAGMEILSTESGGERKFVLVYPEDGCANENLFAELSASKLDLERLQGDGDVGIFTIDDPPGQGGPLW